MEKPDDKKLESNVLELFDAIGEDGNREGLLKTPNRFVKAFKYLNSGYETSLEEIINGALFEVRCSEMVIVKDIEFYSMCEHHLLPFFGKCHVGYIPHNRIIGLSKIPRIVEMNARRLQVQENLTFQVAETLMKVLRPLGVGVVMEGQHLCMMMRGVQKQNSSAKTSALLGQFQAAETRSEFFNLIKS